MLDTKEENSTNILEKKADDFIILQDFEKNPACINVDKNSDQEISLLHLLSHRIKGIRNSLIHYFTNKSKMYVEL